MKNIIKKYGFLFVLFSIATITHAKSFSEKELYAQGQAIIDAYTGNTDDLKRAYNIFAKIAEKNPKSVYALVGMGRVFYKAGYINGDNYEQTALDKAEEYFAYARQTDPTFFDAYYYGSYVYLFSKDYDTAKNLIRTAQDIRPNAPHVDLIYGEIAVDTKDYPEAIRRANLVLSKSAPKKLQIGAHGILKNAYKKQKQFELAEREYLKLIALEPDSAWAKSNYSSYLRWKKKDYDAAISYGEQALALMDFGMGHHVLGKAYYYKGRQLQWEQKNYNEARQYFQKAIEHKPDYANAYYGLGMSYYQTGYVNKNKDEIYKAEQALARAVELKPAHKQATEQLSRIRKLIEHLGK